MVRLLTPLLFLTLLASAQADLGATSLNEGWHLQDIAKVPQTGAVLSAPSYKPTNWYKAVVPGTILTTLVKNGVYPEPFYGLNNLSIPDSLCRTSYWYRKTVTIPKTFAGQQTWIRFDGINYTAEIWVNGHQAGRMQGAFSRGTFNITPFVKPGQKVAIAVKVDPQPHPGEPHQKSVANGTGPNGGESARDGATFLAAIGWDWIPTIRDRNTGIWQGVTLYSTGAVVLKDPYVSSDVDLTKANHPADVTIETTVQNVSSKPVTGFLQGGFERVRFKQNVRLGPGETRKVVLTPAVVPALHLAKPALWYPNGYGNQTMHNLKLTFQTGGRASDLLSLRFGIRKIQYTLPGSDNLALSVNGIPVLCKGGDWGMDEGMKRIDPARLEAQISMHAQANYTMIRNWVGQSTSEDFYSLCDQHGILIWDEFFQPNPSDGPNPDDTVNYLANVREKILRFRNHPSIALWCARNEGNPPPIIHQGIDALNKELDGKRLYQPSSTDGRGVRSGGPYHWREPRHFYEVDAPFKTEIGTVSIPTLEALHAMMPEKDWETINEDWAEHDFTRGAQGGDWFPRRLAARYGVVKDTPDFVRKGQMMTYESYRAMYEGRNAKLFAPVTGVLTWMSNPSQPSFVWQLYTHDLEPNAALFATASACEPIHIQLNQSDWHVMVINNTPKHLTGYRARVDVYNLDGTLAYSNRPTPEAAPSSALDLGAVEFPTALSPTHFVVVRLFDPKGQMVSRGFYWRSNPDIQDDFRALDSLPKVQLKATARFKDGDGNVRIVNPSKSVALMVHLQLRDATTGRRILPVTYWDNYVSLLPGESRIISILARGASKPVVAIDGWNVVPMIVHP